MSASPVAHDADALVVGAGLAGLVATAELADRGRRVILLDQEPEASLGGQAFWSLGGLFLVDTPEQRRLGVADSRPLARQDWLGSAAFDRPEDYWPRRWADLFLDFAAGEARDWLRAQGVRFFPVVQWAERGGGLAGGHGNSVPRFHVTWGTGPGLVEPFVRRVRAAEDQGLVSLRFRHRVTGLVEHAGAISGVEGERLVPSSAARGRPSSREPDGRFELHAPAVIVTSGGIGANHELVRRHWPEAAGQAPAELLSGVPDHVDGHLLEATAMAGAHLINQDRMWHYPEGIANHAPVWSRHGLRILSGPSPLWLDAYGRRLPAPLFPGWDTLGALQHILRTGRAHSWFLLDARMLHREIVLSGSEQNPELAGSRLDAALRRARDRAPQMVRASVRHGSDFVQGDRLSGLVRAMNDLVGEALIDPAALEAEVAARDQQVGAKLGKDAQVMGIRAARRYLGDRLLRVSAPHRLLDPEAGPLLAVRLRVLTRKTLGGLETDLAGRVLGASGEPLPGLYAAGEAAGFGGGGMHGYRSLEGTFLGGCLLSGRVAGRAVADQPA